MEFHIDTQTIDDLNLLNGDQKSPSVDKTALIYTLLFIVLTNQ